MTMISAFSGLNPWQTTAARIVEIVEEIDGVATYRLCAPDNAPVETYRFRPGQFNMLYLPGVGEAAISMSGDPKDPREWIHTVRVAGNVTRTLAALRSGDTLGVRGPFGTGWPVNELRGSALIIVAGGLGLAPLRPLIYEVARDRSRFGEVSLIIGARAPESLLYGREYDDWRRTGIEVHVTVDRANDQWAGNVGVVTTILDRMNLSRAPQTALVTCGPEIMMKYVALAGLRRGIPADRSWISMERNMQCAVGLCGHCQWGAAFICKDGPVLRYDRVQSYFLVESL